MKESSVLNHLLESLADTWIFHASDTTLNAFYKAAATEEIKKLYSDAGEAPVSFGMFGDVAMPYFKMGAIDSLDLFGLDELIMFAYYWRNKNRYKRALDIGANIGLHSIILGKCGISVKAFEPDPVHYKKLQANLALNKITTVEAVEMAVSNQPGQTEFIRVVGNTTSSHIAGAKSNPYGELERFPVKIEAIQNVCAGIDLIKMDAEGHEKEILLAIPMEHWKHMDAMVEIGSEENADAVFNHFNKAGIKLFAQRKNWQRVDSAQEMPIGHRGGTLFITSKDAMNWK